MDTEKKTMEIDVIASVKKIITARKSLTVSVISGVVLGIIIAFSTPKTYTSEVILAPELSSGGLGLSSNLMDMASSFGVDLGSTNKSMDALYPEIYPEILSSYDFIHGLFDVPVRLKNDNTTRTYFRHVTVDTKIPFWQYPKAWLAKLSAKDDTVAGNTKNGKKDPFKTSKIDSEICEAIGKSINCLIDKKTSVILIGVTDQDPLVAAIIADTIQNRLQNYITSYRTKKARTDFNYYKKLYNDAKAKYTKAQNTYASFCDANQDVVLEKYIAKRDELENEMQTAFTLMNQMSTQMQAAKAKIQERTPAYTMIKSAKMPYKASSMSRLMILALVLFVAMLADAFWVLFLKDILKKK